MTSEVYWVTDDIIYTKSCNQRKKTTAEIPNLQKMKNRHLLEFICFPKETNQVL